MLIVADKQILCGSCGALVGLRFELREQTVVLKDSYVVIVSPKFYFCNSTCKERAQV
jgi:hypothetical protein